VGKSVKQYDPNAILYRWLFREDDQLPRLIGTDPELADRSRFFRWIDEPGGWEKREPWPQGATNIQSLDNAAGTTSGWPGAIPIPAKMGRPRNEATDEDKVVSMSFSIRRGDLIDLQRVASDARQTTTEWISGVIRAEIERSKKT